MINNAEAVVEVSVVYKKSCSRVCLFSPVGRGYGLNVLERSACYTNRITNNLYNNDFYCFIFVVIVVPRGRWGAYSREAPIFS